MPKEIIVPAGSPPPLAPYSPGTKAGGMVYVSGMLAMDRDGKTVGVGDVKVQTRSVLNAIKSVVETAGGSMSDIVYNAIFLKDLADGIVEPSHRGAHLPLGSMPLVIELLQTRQQGRKKMQDADKG